MSFSEASRQTVVCDMHNQGVYLKIIYLPGKSGKNALTTASGRNSERLKPLDKERGKETFAIYVLFLEIWVIFANKVRCKIQVHKLP